MYVSLFSFGPIVLSVLLRFTHSDYHFGIFKLFSTCIHKILYVGTKYPPFWMGYRTHMKLQYIHFFIAIKLYNTYIVYLVNKISFLTYKGQGSDTCLNVKLFNLSSFERTWWNLFQKRVVRTKFDIYVLLFYTLTVFCSVIYSVRIRG